MEGLIKRNPALQKALDQLGIEAYGRTNGESISTDTCIRCGKPAGSFKDQISLREYRISGLCQPCQDIVFNPFAEDDEEF